MGNTQEFRIPPSFNKSCHIKLANGSVNSQLAAIQLYTSYDEKYQQWRWNLDQLYSHEKYLFIPKYFHDKGISLTNCQTRKSVIDQIGITVGYEPFIFTLKKEVMARKINGRKFENKQIKKVLKNLIYAVKSWFHVYPDLSIGKMEEGNIILNSEGQIKVVHVFSFPPEDFLILKGKAVQYTEVNPINCLFRRSSIMRKDIFLFGYAQEIVALVFRLLTMQQVDGGVNLSEDKIVTGLKASLLDEKIVQSLIALYKGDRDSQIILMKLQSLYSLCGKKQK